MTVLKPCLLLACLVLLGAGTRERPDSLLKDFLDAPEGPSEDEALKAALAEKDIPLEDWVAAIRRRPYPTKPPEPRVSLDIPLPSGKPMHCVVLVPPGYDPATPCPLLLFNPDVWTPKGVEAWATPWEKLATDSGVLIACAQSMQNDWNFSDEMRTYPLAALRALKDRFNVDEDRVHLGGECTGGIAAWDVGLRYPHLFASHATQACSVFNHGVPYMDGFYYLENALGLPLWHRPAGGDFKSGEEACRQLKAMGYDATLFEKGGGLQENYPGLLAWALAHARQAWPKKLFCRCHDLRYARRAWTGILRFDEDVVPENPRKLMLPGKPATSKEQMQRDKRIYVVDHAALLTAEAGADNAIAVQTRHVREFALYLGDGLIDLSKPVRVAVNGKKAFEGKVSPSTETLLRMFKRDRDRKRLFKAEIHLRP